jgi:hypothetical protein
VSQCDANPVGAELDSWQTVHIHVRGLVRTIAVIVIGGGDKVTVTVECNLIVDVGVTPVSFMWFVSLPLLFSLLSLLSCDL